MQLSNKGVGPQRLRTLDYKINSRGIRYKLYGHNEAYPYRCLNGLMQVRKNGLRDTVSPIRKTNELTRLRKEDL